MVEEKISIIMPMYKGKDFVGDAIESVLKQTYKNWELIIVDDCSPDNGAGIAEVKKYIDERIILIESKINKGSSGARNIALKKASAKLISFLDSDDIWHENFLSNQISFMKKNNAIFVFSSYNRIDEFTKKEKLSAFIVPNKVKYFDILKSNPIFPSTVIYDSSKTKKLYLFNEKFKSMRDDYIYFLEILKDIDYAYGNSEILVDYRMRKDSATGNKIKTIKPQWRVLREVEKLNLFKSSYYFTNWAIKSIIKYKK